MHERPIKRIYYSSKFEKALGKMPQFVKRAFIKRGKLFLSNAFHPSLDAHPLHGKYMGFWSFTVIGQYRVMFAFRDSHYADFVNIGTHEIYR